MKLLIIDNDRDIISFLRERFLERDGIIDHAFNAIEGIRMAKMNNYDIIIVNHPAGKKTGACVCNEIRSQQHRVRRHVPIIIISHDNNMFMKIRCFESGADDYILKPFFFEELYARIKTILRRPAVMEPTILSIDDLELNLDIHKITRAGKAIYLTKKEYAIFEYMMRHVQKILSRSDIVEHVWDIHANPFSNMLEMHMLNLRKKINLPGKKPLIHCVVGRGYKIDTER